MTPEERTEFNRMKQEIAELQTFMRQKKAQQISAPIDVTSQNILYQSIPKYMRDSTNPKTSNGYVEVLINGRTFFLLKGV